MNSWTRRSIAMLTDHRERDEYREWFHGLVTSAEKSLRLHGLEHTIANFPGLDQYPDLFRYCGDEALVSTMDKSSFWLGKHRYFKSLEDLSTGDVRGDTLEGRLEVEAQIENETIPAGEGIPAAGVPAGTEFRAVRSTFRRSNHSTDNFYILCHSLPESDVAREKYGPYGYRIKHYPIFIAALNLSMKNARHVKKQAGGTLRFMSVGPANYVPKSELEDKMIVQSLRDPLLGVDAVWFKEDGLIDENEGRMVWKAPDDCNADHIKITCPLARQLIEPL